ncbi:MAG: MBL fold metallo-hydrolase [Ardenticatenaceae bacterium]|nr:MBL fold metallo-hydrolase [Anaerolineales bacterium]MCB9006781.1 MBL fold metallo-hydrolase [Ardenticatenaceae bacterium]
MVRERIADDIYVFTSQSYAQVTAGAILTKDGVILIDTLYFPEETKAIKEFLEERQGLKIRYVINTHYHADHTQGTYLFPEAQIVSHAMCRQLLDSKGRSGLADAQAQMAELEEVQIILPELVFKEGVLNLYLGGKTLQLHHMPGHSLDLVGVYVVNNQILFASDNSMPVPTFFDGSYRALVASLQKMIELEPDTIVQGHGEVILRGEVHSVIEDDLNYLAKIREKVAKVVSKSQPVEMLDKVGIESCGKSRIPLNGLVSDLHRANLYRLYDELREETAVLEGGVA